MEKIIFPMVHTAFSLKYSAAILRQLFTSQQSSRMTLFFHFLKEEYFLHYILLKKASAVGVFTKCCRCTVKFRRYEVFVNEWSSNRSHYPGLIQNRYFPQNYR